MKTFFLPACVLVSVSLLAFCRTGNQTSAETETRGLKDYYKDYFSMGVAVSPRALKTDESGLILRHFNSLTAENAMKMGPIHPRERRSNK